MASNRLYIIDTETGEKFCFAKSMDNGWYCVPEVSRKFEEWADLRDIDASYCGGGKSNFIFVCENNEEFQKYTKTDLNDSASNSAEGK